MLRIIRGIALFAMVVMCARADFIVSYSGSGLNSISGNSLAAEVDFLLSGNALTVTLTNTAGINTSKYVPSDALTVVFFGGNSLSLTTGTATAPKVVKDDGTVMCDTGTCDISPGWQFLSFSPAQYSARNGISATGLGIFGPTGNFLPGPGDNLDGADYGVLPANYPGNLGQNVNKDSLAINSGVFHLTFADGTAPTTQEDLIEALGAVTFQYGTGLTEPHITTTVIPEPTSILLFGSLVLVTGVAIRKRG